MSSQSRVNKGAALLDERAAGWKEGLRLEKTASLSEILEQLFGNVPAGVEYLGLRNARDLQKHGFATVLSATSQRGKLEFEGLLRRWREKMAPTT